MLMTNLSKHFLKQMPFRVFTALKQTLCLLRHWWQLTGSPAHTLKTQNSWTMEGSWNKNKGMKMPTPVDPWILFSVLLSFICLFFMCFLFFNLSENRTKWRTVRTNANYKTSITMSLWFQQTNNKNNFNKIKRII